MKRSFYPKAFFCLIAVTPWAFCNGAAQLITRDPSRGVSR